MKYVGVLVVSVLSLIYLYDLQKKALQHMKSNISLSFSVAFDKSDMTGDMNQDTFEAKIAGLSFYVDFDDYAKYSIEGGYIKAEPQNEHDPNAIAIYHDSGKHIGYISKESIIDVKKFTDGENAPCIIYMAPFIDHNGEKGLKGVVRIFRYYDGETDYINNAIGHFINAYALRLKDDMDELDAKLDKRHQNLLTPNVDDDGHLTFKGIPINGPVEKIRAKIIDIGFKPDGEALVGRFAGLKVKVYVASNEDMNLAYSVIVHSEQEKSWLSLKRKYLSVRELYIKKYDQPVEDIQRFASPYDEGDGDELEATDDMKCFYKSRFSVPGGEVSIFIAKRSIMIFFDDAINKKYAENEEEEMEEDFEDDYDAYDDI